MKETKLLVNPSFPVILYEMAELMTYGWTVSQEVCPNAAFTYYEVEMYRDEESIALMQQRVNKAEAGKQDRTKQVMQENLAANRTKRWKKEDGDAG
jgi:hypothetical protein